MATLNFTLDTLNKINENLIIISGQLVLGHIEPDIAEKHVNALKTMKNATVDALFDSYRLTPEQFDTVSLESNKADQNFDKIENYIAYKKKENLAENQAQPE